jgi:VanZ family protein
MKTKQALLIITILWTLFIFSQSLLPGDVSSSQSGFIVDVLYPWVGRLGINIQVDKFSFIIRKLAHFTEYTILGILLLLMYQDRFTNKKLYLISFLHGTITAISDETIQRFVPNRSGELRDVLIDMGGVLFGVLIIHLVNRMLKLSKH